MGLFNTLISVFFCMVIIQNVTGKSPIHNAKETIQGGFNYHL